GGGGEGGGGGEAARRGREGGGGAPAGDPGEGPKGDTEGAGGRPRGEPEAGGDPPAVENAAQDVAPEVIRAEGMLAQSPRLPHGRPEPLHQHLARGVPRRDLRREHGRPAHAEKDGEAEDGAEAQSAAERRGRGADGRRHGDARRLAHRWLRASTMRGSRYV